MLATLFVYVLRPASGAGGCVRLWDLLFLLGPRRAVIAAVLAFFEVHQQELIAAQSHSDVMAASGAAFSGCEVPLIGGRHPPGGWDGSGPTRAGP